MKKSWIYYGIFFSDKTMRAILEHAKHWIYKKFNNEIPDDWKIYCDHVTLVFNDGSPKRFTANGNHRDDYRSEFDLYIYK